MMVDNDFPNPLGFLQAYKSGMSDYSQSGEMIPDLRSAVSPRMFRSKYGIMERLPNLLNEFGGYSALEAANQGLSLIHI